MLKSRLHSAIPLLLTLKNRSHTQASSLVANSFIWNKNSKQLSTYINGSYAAANKNKITVLEAIDTNTERSCCKICKRVFTENPLSRRSRRTCICIGCKRLYAQCRNDLDMRLMESIQTFKFGHGTCHHDMMSQQMIAQNQNYFTANKFKPDVQANVGALTQMAGCWDRGGPMADIESKEEFWNDPYLDLSTLLDIRASSFRYNNKKRYRKYFPNEKLVNEEFIFPTHSQVRGFMEASNGICSWSGLRGQWRVEKSSPLFLLTIDHIVPVSKRGSPNVHNLQVVLSVYNSVKSNESESEIRRWLYSS